MTQEEKIQYMTLAANLCKFGFNRHHTDLLVSLYELIIETKGEATLKDIAVIEVESKNREDVKCKQDLLDKVSTKI